MSKEFLSDDAGRVSGVRTVRVEWVKDDNGRWQLKELPDTEHVSISISITTSRLRYVVVAEWAGPEGFAGYSSYFSC